MVDMSAHFQEQFLSFDLNKIKDRVQDFSPVIQVVRDTWDHQTLGEILEGRVYLPDDVLNEMLAERVTGRENTPLSSLRLTCHENGIMDIDAMTKKGDKVELSGTIEKFIHKGDTSCLVYRVKKHRLPGHGISSWLFSQVSLAMAQRLMGKVETPENLPTSIQHNTVTVDFSRILAESKFGRAELEGSRLLDMLEIKEAKPKEGGLEIDVDFHVDDNIKSILKRMVR